MKKTEIKIDMDDVMRIVRENAALYASKMVDSDSTSFERIETSEPEEEVLLDAARRARTYVTNVTRRYKMNVEEVEENGSKTWLFSFMCPNNFDINMETSIQGAIRDYLMYSLLAEWFGLCGDADRQKVHLGNAAMSLQSVTSYINTRIPPTYEKPKMKRVVATKFE